MRNGEADFASYRIYRGDTGDFQPGPANLVATLPDTGYIDPNGAAGYYKISAVDLHGNESVFATYPASTVDVPPVGEPLALALARPLPNPAQGVTRIAFELPQAARVALTIHDASGRTVRELARGPRTAGRSELSWDLRDDAGRPVPSGVYFVRLAADGRTLTQRMVALR